LNNFQKLVLVLGGISLSGCSYLYSEEGLIKDRTFEYLDARETKDLNIPPELKQKNKVNYAQVPAIGEAAKNAPFGKELKVNAPVQILAVLENMRLDKKSADPAVFIVDDFEFLWANILSIFEEREINLAKVDKTGKTIDTGWLAQDEDGIWLGLEDSEEIDEFKTRFQIKITEGQLKNEYRIESRRVGAEILDEEDNWKPISSFWHDSAEMLNLIISKYDQSVAEREIAERKRAIAGFTVELSTNSDGDAALITAADKEDVWVKLPDVLIDLGFEVHDRDRQLMTYFTEYLTEEDGFFASLFSEDRVELPIESGNYQITVSELGERTAITIKDDQGNALESGVMGKLFPVISSRFGERK